MAISHRLPVKKGKVKVKMDVYSASSRTHL